MFAAVFSFLRSNAMMYAIGAILATVVIGGMYLKGRSDGAAVVKVAEIKVYKKGIENHDKIEREVKSLPDADLDKRLGKWMRD